MYTAPTEWSCAIVTQVGHQRRWTYGNEETSTGGDNPLSRQKPVSVLLRALANIMEKALDVCRSTSNERTLSVTFLIKRRP